MSPTHNLLKRMGNQAPPAKDTDDTWAIVGQPWLFFQEGTRAQRDRCMRKHVTPSKTYYEALMKKRDDVLAARTAGEDWDQPVGGNGA